MEADPRLRDSVHPASAIFSAPSANPQVPGSYNNDGGSKSPHASYASDSSPTDSGGGGLTNNHPAGAAAAGDVISTDPLLDLKRPRACEACRQLKVRCDPDNDHPHGWCKRCIKANRRCVVTAPTRKRQKKADSRVAELEKKIDALTASLQASRARSQPAASSQPPEEEFPTSRWLGQVTNRASSEWRRQNGASSGSPTSLAGHKRGIGGNLKANLRGSGFFPPLVSRSHSPGGELSSAGKDASSTNNGDDVSGSWPPLFASLEAATKGLRCDNEYTDVIDRGVVDTETATLAFNRYVHNMAPQFPAVVFPPGTMMSEIRRLKPVLFLAIMSISIGAFRPQLQHSLANELHRVLADRTVIRGEKSLELVQAILLTVLWYAPPDHFEELKFYQLIHMAAVMGMDIGMNRRANPKSAKSLGMWRELMGKKAFPLDNDAPETRRAWVGCYFMAVNASMSLRRPLLVRWLPYLDECLDILQNSPNSLPSDKALAHWLELVHIGEEISFQFSMDDPASNANITNPKIQYALKGFEKRLEEWRKEVPQEHLSPIMQHFHHVLNVYMHEIGMHIDHNIDDFKPPFVTDLGEDTAANLGTAAHVEALTVCLTSIHDAFNTLLSMDPKEIQCVPTINLVRTSYASVALIKLWAAARAPSSRLTHVFNADDFKVEDYLNKVIHHLKFTGESPGGRTAGKFSLVLGVLKTWFLRQRDGKSVNPSNMISTSDLLAAANARGRAATSNAADSGRLQNQASCFRHSTPERAGTNQTSLELLSEAAMGRPASGSDMQQHSHNRDPHLHPQGTNQPGDSQMDTDIRMSSASASLPASAPVMNTSGITSTLPPNESWPNYNSGSRPLFPVPPQSLPQYQDTTQAPMFSAGPILDGQQAQLDPQDFIDFPSLQLSIGADELVAFGNLLEDNFFPFPMDGSMPPWQ
ncbi:hypothetical protein AJ80_09475 [Polytolypa hystricis UAMH7299]|uniref:Zn(2)-C6 fungal-type domain-containing protein n=1 Tax=Polytolypa hystricis (strain UAMH7299) TaxID=1447883 RepID=A0A2B7WQM7_POLH7|nr:hypothetical protein AJ80_09475 [Polytolypa hystricis UAMH7299]